MMVTRSPAYNPRDIAEYNPADLENLVRYCVEELMYRGPYPLALPAKFPGAGIYALFYDGDFNPYQHPVIRSPDARRPIYVGRARQTKKSGPNPLFNRLRDHEKSIRAAQNLRIEDFRCRFLVLHPVWVSTVEDLLIEHYSALWNGVVQGFGVHDPGGKRHGGDIPVWDVLHPGRSHLPRMIEQGAAAKPITEIERLIEDYCATQSAPRQYVSREELLNVLAERADDENDDGGLE